MLPLGRGSFGKGGLGSYRVPCWPPKFPNVFWEIFLAKVLAKVVWQRFSVAKVWLLAKVWQRFNVHL